jgi:hypothetical protein
VPERPATLDGVALAWIGNILPARPRPFLLMVAAISAACWGLGYLMAADRARFLETHEWQAQPFFLAAHFIALRLFLAVYARNFLTGAVYLDLSASAALARVRRLLGPPGVLIAVLVAAPFCVKDLLLLSSDKYASAAFGPDGTLGGTDYLMAMIWCVEWLLNAYIWVLLAGFLVLTMRTLLAYPFRDPVEVILHQKQYRPFLTMSSQGASILLAFGLVNGAYIWYTSGEITDYIGLAITIVLLVLGFVPPWLKIKKSMDGMIQAEIYRLRECLIASGAGRRVDGASGGETDDPQAPSTQLSDAVAMLRIDYLDRLQQDLGRAEGKAILLKLLAPMSAIVWKYIRVVVGI